MGGQPTGISPAQSEVIRRHLALVFVHEIDPSMGGTKTQMKLNEIHGDPGKILYRC